MTATFEYDPLRRRTRKVVNGQSTEFLYDGPNPVQEKDGPTIPATLLTGLGIDEYFTRTDAAGRRTLLADALGSILALADDAGTVQTEYSYEPFGATTQTGAPSTNPFQYTGRENDQTGLYYYRARYYSGLSRRFVGEDPIGFRGGDFNFYAYVLNSPTNRTDPTGMIVTSCFAPDDRFLNGDGLAGRKYGAYLSVEYPATHPELPPALDPNCVRACQDGAWQEFLDKLKVDLGITLLVCAPVTAGACYANPILCAVAIAACTGITIHQAAEAVKTYRKELNECAATKCRR